MAVAGERKIAPWKQEAVDKLLELFNQYPVVGILDISNLPASQFQTIRKKLQEHARIVVSKNTLIKLALERGAELREQGLARLTDYLKGQSALIFSRINPFKLSKILRENVTSAPAKPGVICPRDVVIPAGETDFSPGPIVGELQRVGIKARIQAGKVVILEDYLLVKKGEVISKEVADVLSKFGIHPMELGLKLKAAYEAGRVYPAELLAVDEEIVIKELQEAWVSGLGLALATGFPTPETLGPLLARARDAAYNLAFNACIPLDQTVPWLLARAQQEMLGLARAVFVREEKVLDEKLKQMLGAGPPEEKPKEKAEEKKPEELSGLGALFG